jgi:hypothetical protein
MNSGSPLAVLFNDKSILESLHSMTLFQVLNKHGINQLFGNTTSESYKGICFSLFLKSFLFFLIKKNPCRI